MRMNFRIICLLAALPLLPLFSRAQSLRSRDVVSVRELSIPPKAHLAFEDGVALLAKNDPGASLPHFQRAVNVFPGYYEAYDEIGVADVKLSRITEAEQALRRSIELSGGQYAHPLMALGAILVSQEKFEEAEGITRRGLNLDASSWSGHYSLGWALLGLNRVAEAEKSAREAVGLKPDSIVALQLLADIHSRQKDYVALLNDLDAYLKLDPNSPTSVRVRALRETAQRLLAESESASAFAQP